MTASVSPDARAQIVNLVREFVQRDVEPVASRYDNEDVYPAELAEPSSGCLCRWVAPRSLTAWVLRGAPGTVGLCEGAPTGS